MSSFQSVIRELETALEGGSTNQRVELLRRITDLFVIGCERFSEQQISIFDEVIGRLISHIESRALAEISVRLAPIANAPAEVIRRLARDDAIGVSGPVLQESGRLTDADLVEIAKTKSQAHLVKIAGRSQLSEAVTDVLVDRGDSQVASEVAGNSGARFSKAGYSMLVMRADGDDTLTSAIASRRDIPPMLFKQLLARATDAVRERLLASAQPETQAAIKQILADIAAQIGRRAGRRDYAEAQSLLHSFSQDTELTRSKLLQFANTNRVPEMMAALSALSLLPINLIDHLIYNVTHYGIMVLCKAIMLDWQSAQVVIRAQQAAAGAGAMASEDARDEYASLTTPSAQRLLRFWQVRQMADAKPADGSLPNDDRAIAEVTTVLDDWADAALRALPQRHQ